MGFLSSLFAKPVTLDRLRNKWREVPIAKRRVFSKDLLALDDASFLEIWKENDAAAERKWYRERYGERLAGKDVLDLGCGFSTDGIHFLRCGARVTFADIVPDNLAATRRAVQLAGLIERADFYYVENTDRFVLPRAYDFIFALGSMHHCPFEDAQREVAAVGEFLRPGGTLFLFTYPKVRFDRSGARDFRQFGKMTDGERTPWAEWYDAEKVLRLVGPGYSLVFTRNFGPTETEFNWFELKKAATAAPKK